MKKKKKKQSRGRGKGRALTYFSFLCSSKSKMGMEVLSVQKAIILVFLIQYCLAQQMPSSYGVERVALLDLRSSLGIRGKDWPIKANHCSSWVGITCQESRVTEINVSGLRRTRAGRLNPSFAVDSLVNLTHLHTFNASGFSLPGSIPEWFGQRLLALQVLDLGYCSVIGSVPSSLGSLIKLRYLYFSNNRLTGALPSTLGQLLELSVLDLSQNSLTGVIPSSLGSLANLTRMDLSSNYFSGSVPPDLGNLLSLQLLNLSDNSLTSSIPIQLGNLSKLVELSLSKNSLSGSLPLEVGGLRSLKVMDISDNDLDGYIPAALWSLPNLHIIDVSRNNFTGSLPDLSANGNFIWAIFNLSNNQLYGNLTMTLEDFDLIDLSGNYFDDKVPGNSSSNVVLVRNCLPGFSDQRSLQECREFYIQRGLTFNDPAAPEQNQSSLPDSESRSKKNLVFMLAGIFGGLGFILILILVLVVLIRTCDKGAANQRESANVGPLPEGESPRLPKDPIYLSCVGESFTYDQILRSTNNLNEENLIKHGNSGDFFQGLLEGGIPVVIKKVDLNFFRRESYSVELGLLSKVSHVRLVPLLGHCLEHENEKFLIYKYMPNRDLASSLHRVTNSEDDKPESLDWITRLKIGIGAAEGLSYLHHECSSPLVHRDVQASSILLDDKFEVRFGSLSGVCGQEDPHQNVLTRLLRKPQTSDQGTSVSSSMSCAYDVYCFGKVLLELVTGKLGISKSDDAATREWLENTLSCISIYDKELVNKIVDPSLILDEDLAEEVWAMAIVARSCLNPKPSKRPLMRHVLKALENPLKVVRDESSSSARLRATSSRRSWSTAFFGSWRQSSSESTSGAGHNSREGVSGFKQTVRLGSHGSDGNDLSSSHKRLSNENFPEPVEMQDMERQDER